eukprot:178541-Pelagomonas_calceolata.AAC.1
MVQARRLACKAHPACTARRAQAEFDNIIVEELQGRPCALRCKGCKDSISPVNPSHQTTQHLMQAAHGAR